VYGPKKVFLGKFLIVNAPNPAFGILEVEIFIPIGTVYFA